MIKIFAIARNTFKEAIRNRILYVILIFALLMIGFAGIVSKLTIASREKIIMDMGFSSINLFGVAIAIFVGVSLVYNELEKKSIYTIVSKPLARWQFLLGKYFGLLMTVWVNILIMTLFFLGSLHFHLASAAGAGMPSAIGQGIIKAFANLFLWSRWELTASVMPVIGITCLEMAVVTAFAIFFSSFSTPALSMFLTVLTFVAGRMNESIVRFAEYIARDAESLARSTGGEVALPASYHIAIAAAHVTPNLGAFGDAVRSSVAGVAVTIPWQTALYYGLYAAAVLTLSMIIFQRRNFK